VTFVHFTEVAALGYPAHPLAEAMDKVHKEFKIERKLTRCTTDSAANFVKAFKEFSPCSDQSNRGKNPSLFYFFNSKLVPVPNTCFLAGDSCNPQTPTHSDDEDDIREA